MKLPTLDLLHDDNIELFTTEYDINSSIIETYEFIELRTYHNKMKKNLNSLSTESIDLITPILADINKKLNSYNFSFHEDDILNSKIIRYSKEYIDLLNEKQLLNDSIIRALSANYNFIRVILSNEEITDKYATSINEVISTNEKVLYKIITYMTEKDNIPKSIDIGGIITCRIEDGNMDPIFYNHLLDMKDKFRLGKEIIYDILAMKDKVFELMDKNGELRTCDYVVSFEKENRDNIIEANRIEIFHSSYDLIQSFVTLKNPMDFFEHQQFFLTQYFKIEGAKTKHTHSILDILFSSQENFYASNSHRQNLYINTLQLMAFMKFMNDSIYNNTWGIENYVSYYANIFLPINNINLKLDTFFDNLNSAIYYNSKCIQLCILIERICKHYKCFNSYGTVNTLRAAHLDSTLENLEFKNIKLYSLSKEFITKLNKATNTISSKEIKDLILHTKSIEIDEICSHQLYELYENGTIFSIHFHEEVNILLQHNIITEESNFFSKSEIEWLNYTLNNKSFNDSLGIRNSYMHNGTAPLTSPDDEQNYYILLKIVIIILIKINADLKHDNSI